MSKSALELEIELADAGQARAEFVREWAGRRRSDTTAAQLRLPYGLKKVRIAPKRS